MPQFDVVRVAESRLIGEIIEMHGDRASIQVYEEPAALPRAPVYSTGEPMSVELGPACLPVFTTAFSARWRKLSS